MKEKIIKLIADKLHVKVAQVKMESKFIEDLGADSLDIVELIMTLEEECGVTLPDEEVAKMTTVGDIVNFLDKSKK